MRTDTGAESERGKKTQSRDDGGGVELEGVAWGPSRSSGREGTERDSEMEGSGGTGGGGEQGGCKSTFALWQQPRASLFSATCSYLFVALRDLTLVSLPFWCSVEGLRGSSYSASGCCVGGEREKRHRIGRL